MPVWVKRNAGGAFNIELQNRLEVTVEVRKSDLLCIYSINSKFLGDSC